MKFSGSPFAFSSVAHLHPILAHWSLKVIVQLLNMGVYLSTSHSGTGCVSGSVGMSLLAPFIVVARTLCQDKKK